jgi:hypothetical protein
MNCCLNTYLSTCRAYQLPQRWNSIRLDQYALQGPSSPDLALETLLNNHSVPELVESGICQLTAGLPALHSLLSEPEVPLIVIRDSTTGECCNLITEGGCVLGDLLPTFEILRDKHTFDVLSGSQRFLLVASDIVDVILLRSFGLAAAPLAGFDRLGAPDLHWLAEYFGIKCGLSDRELEARDENRFEEVDGEEDSPSALGDRAASVMPLQMPYVVPGTGYLGTEHEDHVPLVLVQWQLHALSAPTPASMHRAIQTLNDLKNFRRLDLLEVNTWKASAHDIQAIGFALNRTQPGWIQEAVLDSLHAGQRMMLAKPGAAPGSAHDLATATEHLHAALLAGSEVNGQRYKEALRAYHRIASQQVTAPLLRQAQAASDLLQRSMRIQFANLNALFLEHLPTVREQVLGAVRSPREISKRGDKAITDLLAISSQLMVLAKELRQCEQRNPVPQPVRRPIPATFPRFKGSDLVSQN